MGFRALAVVFVSCLFWFASWVVTPAAFALTQVKLLNLSYHDCPSELAQGNVTSGGGSLPAKCFMVTGKAKNTSGKTVFDADVYGRIYDANNNPVMENRSRVGSIAEVPPGVSDFEIRITVPANQPTPLKLQQFKASGFAGKVRPLLRRD
ncbi:MAG: hypothetical protein AB4426_32440 [Xenococcaceae cyanobacterium]